MTYYVSSSSGSDSNNGTSEATPFGTIAQVNALKLQPGDRVLFKCGNTWRGEQLVIGKSGTEGAPITFSSYPAGCENKPILSGAQPVSGWTASGTSNVYVANLGTGANAGQFAYGVNQLFRGDARLPLGRWPNLDTANGGYATIDAHSGSQITDAALPAGDWKGAVAHLRGMTWYILNRAVTADSGSALTLGAAPDCWGGCAGWGYFLHNHMLTLDQEGEWYYHTATRQLYLYTTGGAPADDEIEASVILKDDDRSWGGVMLGVDLNERGISYVVIENLDVRRWFRHGIATPTNHAHSENHHLTLRDNAIADVDGAGINLAAWVWDADDGRPDGWRGGHHLVVEGNVIDTANHMGINTYSRDSGFSNNVIRNVGLVHNLGAAGLGCGLTDGGGHCTEDGDGLRIKIDRPDDTGCYNTLSGNRLERIAYNGFDVFGHHNTFTYNVVQDACYTKADCGGVRTFGDGDLSTTPVYDLGFTQNILVNPIGNMDGCKADIGVRAFGFYIDHYSRNVALSGNAVISATVHGVLFQDSTGSVTGNTLYNNGRAWDYAAQVYVGSSPAYVSTHTDNVLYGLGTTIRTLSIDALDRLGTSGRNYFFNPYRTANIAAGSDRTLAQWQAYSGQDGDSKAAWFSQAADQPPRSRILYNDTPNPKLFDLGARTYLDLDQNAVQGSLSLPPFTALVLVDNGEIGLTLQRMTPALWGAGEAADFSLTVYGSGFSANSVVHWGGSARPTSMVASYMLAANISAADVDEVADIPVTVYDPTKVPAETVPLTFRVVASVSRIYLPVVMRY
ncbi:MAG: right-handed parallel beta-helix repeat-containing protein [Thermoflexales bacterium]|nr:right-handed parallel beta-helix repeat-containing protein [Thermoflexales bacterium]